MKEFTVKARERQGTKSIDLTLPAEIRRKYSIVRGDIFKVVSSNNEGNLKITYELIYKQK